MPKMFAQCRTLEGEPIVVGETRVIPMMREYRLQWPHGGITWRRPMALRLEGKGTTDTVPIMDVTLRAMGVAVAVGIIFATLIWALARLRRS